MMNEDIIADRPITMAVLHCSDTYSSMDIGAKEIDRWHRDNGWSSCGYHFVITKNGTIEKGRSIHQAGAHAKGYNVGSIGICYVGGRSDNDKPVDDRTPEQKRSIAALIINLQTIYPDIIVKGHNELSGGKKSCPNYDVQKDEKSYVDYLFL